MSKSLVGLTIGQYQDSAIPYKQALEAAGLEVRLLRSVDVTAEHESAAHRMLEGLSGVVLAGGGDIDPVLLGREDAFHATVYGVDPNRDRWELAVFHEAWRQRMPLFAICRGMQVMNWALGGTLFADIDDCCEPRGAAKGHRQTDNGHNRQEASHPIAIEPASLLHKIVGTDRLEVNSIHHQSVRDVASGIIVTARADDGVIEAMEDPSHDFALAVQFHPEEMWRESDACRAMFAAFRTAAERHDCRTHERASRQETV